MLVTTASYRAAMGIRLACCLIALALPAASASSSAFPGTDARLVFAQGTLLTDRYDYPESYLCAVDPDGGRQSRLESLTPSNVSETQPAYSADGRSLVFVRTFATVGDLVIADSMGINPRPIIEAASGTMIQGSEPTFSADGEWIIYSAATANDGTSSAQSLFRVRRDGSGRERLTTLPGWADGPDAAPDGRHVAFSWGREARFAPDVAVLDLVDGSIDVVAASSLAERSPTVSPEGARIAFAVNGDFGNRIESVAFDGSDRRTEPATEGGFAPAYSPSGRLLAFVRDDGVWVADLAARTARAVVATGFSESSPAWQPGGHGAPAAQGSRSCVITGADGDDVLRGTAGADVFADRGGNDRIEALGGNDVVFDGPGDDVVELGAGDDTAYPGAGRNVVLGGPGDDRIVGSTAALVGGVPDAQPQRIAGGPGRDRLHGGRAADTIDGGPADDGLWGYRGSDRLDGGAGDDVVQGMRGADRVDGGAGDDTVAGDSVTPSGTRVGGRDVVLGGAGRDKLFGGSAADRLLGGDGDDVLLAGEGDDTLAGGTGHDRLVGLTGADRLLARDGLRDALDGGPGRDWALRDPGLDVVRGVEAFARS